MEELADPQFQAVSSRDALFFARTPTQLRERASASAADQAPGVITVRLAYRAPIQLSVLLAFLGRRAVPEVEHFDGTSFHRTLRLPRADGLVTLSPAAGGAAAVLCRLRLADLRDLPAAVSRCRSLLDLDADPLAIDAALGADPLLAPLIAAGPGRRVPGTVDGAELLMRAILGQQVTVAAATTLAGLLAAQVGERSSLSPGGATETAPQLLFPSAAQTAEIDPASLAMPTTRWPPSAGAPGAPTRCSTSGPPDSRH